MDCSTPGFPILHYLPECAQTQIHWVSDANQQSHPLPTSHLIPFSSCPQSFPASGSFPMSRLFASGGQSIGASFSTSAFSMNIQGWFPLGLTCLILLSKGLSKSLLQHHSSKALILLCSAFFMVQLSHPYMTTGKTIALTIWTFLGKLMSLLFNTLFRFVIAFLPRASFNFMAAVIFHSNSGTQENEICHCFFFPIYCHEVMGPDAMIFIFWMLRFNPNSSLKFSLTIRPLSIPQISSDLISPSLAPWWKCESESVSHSVVSDSCDTMNCGPPGSSVHGIPQARIREWVTMPFSKGSSWPRNWTQVSYIGRQILYHLSHHGSPVPW